MKRLVAKSTRDQLIMTAVVVFGASTSLILIYYDANSWRQVMDEIKRDEDVQKAYKILKKAAVFAFPQERPVLAPERAFGLYVLFSYFMSRMAGDLPMELALPTAFTVIVYLMVGLNPSPAAFALTLAVILSYVLVAEGLRLDIGAVMMDAKSASTLVIVIMLAYLLTGGFYVHNVPDFMMCAKQWAKNTSLTYYCYRRLIAVQYSGRLACALLPRKAVRGEATPAACVSKLVAMFFAYRVLPYLTLCRV
ncbi:ABC transporter G family member 25-like [Oryza brachyantha]|uniref:ABC transporter G family member 25-like n=1 Tax=Oryza brachyantha TaxID=4533 RepID=UPI001AD9C9E8|nr:ABC transporter G family member 25-like [Oryza brachyantha]